MQWNFLPQTSQNRKRKRPPSGRYSEGPLRFARFFYLSILLGRQCNKLPKQHFQII